MQTRRITRTVWVEKKAFLEFVRSMRSFSFVVHPQKSEYVKEHEESMIPVKIDFEYEWNLEKEKPQAF